MLKQRRLGQTDIWISPIGLGCWQFSKGRGYVGRYWRSLDNDTTQAIVHASLSGGINWFDTAEVYGWGASEKSLVRALKELGKPNGSIIIASKWWPLFRTARHLTRTIDKRLDTLQGYSIDLYQIHQPYSLSSIRSQVQAMAGLFEQGKIKSIGVSNFSAQQMRTVHDLLKEQGLGLASNQMKYSLLDRRIEFNGILETARELGITIIAYSPLEQGLLTGKFHHDPERIKSRLGPRKYMQSFRKTGLEKTRPLIEKMETMAEKYQVTCSQIALNWLVQFNGSVVVAIPGASSVRQAEENAHAMELELSTKDLEVLNDLSRKVQLRQ